MSALSALLSTLLFAASPDVHVGRTGPARLGPAPLITDDGKWAGNAAEQHLKAVGFDARGSNYSIVAVVGPQSSGKSTLLNALYGASFEEMTASEGRSQTTRGIWMQCPAAQPDLLLLDVQGTDSIEGGEASKTFERQAALFVLGLADVLVINVWEHDVGRQEASTLGLLQLVLEANVELCGAAPPRRRPTLLFVVRDHVEEPGRGTPLAKLAAQLTAQLHTAWAELKPPAAGSAEGGAAAQPAAAVDGGGGDDEDAEGESGGAEGAPPSLDALFDVEVAALPHLALQPEAWHAAARSLGERISRLAAGRDGRDGRDAISAGQGAISAAERRGADEAGERAADGDGEHGGGERRDPCAGVSADALPAFAEGVWGRIAAHKALDLPTTRWLAADTRCRAIGDRLRTRCARRMAKLSGELFAGAAPRGAGGAEAADAVAAAAPPAAFAARGGGLLLRGLAQYDAETARFVESARLPRRTQLQRGQWRAARPLARQQLRRLAAAAAAQLHATPPTEDAPEGAEAAARAAVLARFATAAAASAPPAEALPSATSWAALQAAQAKALRSTLRAQQAQARTAHALRAARAREAAANARAAMLARGGLAPLTAAVKVLVALLVLHRLVQLLRRPLLPLAAAAAAYYYAPATSRWVLLAALQFPLEAARQLADVAGVTTADAADEPVLLPDVD